MSFIEKTLYDEDGNPFQVQVPVEDQPQHQAPESNNVRAMREKIKELEADQAKNKELAEKVQQYERAETIRQAGLTLDETQRRALEAAHAGEWNPELVRQTAVNLKWADPLPPEGASQEEKDAHERMNAARTGGTTTPPDKEAELDVKLANAKSEVEFMEIYRASGRPLSQD